MEYRGLGPKDIQDATGAAKDLEWKWRKKDNFPTEEYLASLLDLLKTERECLFSPPPGGPGEGRNGSFHAHVVAAIDDVVVVDVLSSVPAGALASHDAVWPFDIERTLTLSGLGEGDWAALLVDGDSMDRIAPSGSVIVFNRADRRLHDGKYYVFRHPVTGEATFKMYGPGDPPRLRPYSNATHDTIYAPDGVEVFGRVRKVIIDT